MTAWLGDLGFAWRALRAQRGFAAVAVATLALGIGANTALFSIVDAVLLRPLPFPEPERLVALWETTPDVWRVAPGTFLDWQREARGFTAMGAFRTAGATLRAAGEAERLDGVAATASYFQVLGVHPALGRTLEPRDEAPGAEPVVVFVPMSRGPRFASNRRSHVLGVIARLDPTADVETAQAGLSALARQLASRHAENEGEGALLTPLEAEIIGDVRPALLVLLCAVGCVLLLACANVAGLLLARAAARGRELAIRQALGAGRARIVRLLLAESLLLACAGGALGALVAAWGVAPLVAALPADVARVESASVDARVLAFALLLSLATAFLFGLAPALQASAGDPLPQLREASPAAGGRGRRRMRAALVTAQVALALLLLTAGGLLLRSFDALRRVDPGFDGAGVLAFDLVLPARYDSANRIDAAYGDLRERLAGLPGVVATALAYDTPLQSNWIDAFEIGSRSVT